MPRFAANLSFLFTELPFLDRFEAAAKAGFKAVESTNVYEAAAADVAARLKANGLTLALFNTPARQRRRWRARAGGPHRSREGFPGGGRDHLRYADATGGRKVHVLAGLSCIRARGATPTLPTCARRRSRRPVRAWSC